jgi:hypothetical protein
VVFGDVVGVEIMSIKGFDHPQPLFVIFVQWRVVAVEVIENAKFQSHAYISILPVRTVCSIKTVAGSDQPSGNAVVIEGRMLVVYTSW